jgi:PST family polysaccharide transporter
MLPTDTPVSAEAASSAAAPPRPANIAASAFWNAVEFGGGEAASFVIFALLARLVAPADFGMIAVIGVVVSFVQVFLAQGFAEAIIQNDRLDDDHLTTAFWSNTFLGAVFAAGTMLFSHPLSLLLGNPHLAPLLQAIAPMFVCIAINGFFQGLLKRHFQFKSMALRALLAVTGGGLVGIAMAVASCGVWSLIGQQMANNLLSVGILWWCSGWSPRLRFSVSRFREMVEFGMHVIGSALITFLARRADVFLLGHFRSAEEVGYYFLAQRLMLSASLVTDSVLKGIALPMLARLQSNPNWFRNSAYRTIRFAGVIYVPCVAGLGLVGAPLIDVLFGHRWEGAVLPLQIFCTAAAIQSLSLLTGPILFAYGRPDAFLRLTAGQAVIFVLAYLAAAPHGIAAVAAATVFATAVVTPLHLAVLRKNVGLLPQRLLREQIEPVGAGLLMAAAVLLLHHYLPGDTEPLLVGIVSVCAGAVVYTATLFATAPDITRQALEVVRARLGRHSPASTIVS